MSLDVLTTEKWLIDQLRRLIGFDEVEEIAAYIMTFPIDDEAGLASYLGELFGSSSDVELLAKGLCSRRKAASEESAEDSNSSSAARVGKSKKKKATPVASYASSPLFASATPPPSADTQTVPAKKLSQKERARLNRLNTIAGGNGGGGGRAEGVEPPAPPSSEAAPAAAEGSGAASSRSMGSGSGVGAGRGIGSGGGVSQQGNNGSGSVRSAPNNEEGGGVEEEEEEEEELDEDGFQRFDVGQLTEAGGVSSSAAGGGRQLTHALTPGGSGALVNCLKCGFINVLPAALVNGSSGKAAKGGTKEMGGKGASASPSGSWGGCSGCGLELERCTDTDPSFALGFTAALALKDRLVRYDHENIERHAVFDDESDYFASSAWLSELETEELQKRDAERHESLHSRRKDMVVTIDFAGRRVVEEVAEGGFDDARNKYKARTADADAEERKAARVASIEQLKEQLAGDCSSAGSSGNRPPSSAAAAATAALSAESLSSSSAEGVSAAATTGESSGGGSGGGASASRKTISFMERKAADVEAARSLDEVRARAKSFGAAERPTQTQELRGPARAKSLRRGTDL
mmetsp:Transcript_76527/g.149982  ORF Transcript_76527/g.149982 Transcript_76527/m.149982 type:complete len:577 (-) Transcript_76527:154-1884(-)